MTAIPFGFIWAVAGHYVMGFPLTILSLIGFVALTGIVVNDSLILVDWVNRRRRAGRSPYDAIIDAGTQRLRAILRLRRQRKALGHVRESPVRPLL